MDGSLAVVRLLQAHTRSLRAPRTAYAQPATVRPEHEHEAQLSGNGSVRAAINRPLTDSRRPLCRSLAKATHACRDDIRRLSFKIQNASTHIPQSAAFPSVKRSCCCCSRTRSVWLGDVSARRSSFTIIHSSALAEVGFLVGTWCQAALPAPFHRSFPHSSRWPPIRDSLLFSPFSCACFFV